MTTEATLDEVKNIVKQRNVGLITDAEAINWLDEMEIRGGFDNDRYIAYDYCNQNWIEVN
jgi:hypothetical protein